MTATTKATFYCCFGCRVYTSVKQDGNWYYIVTQYVISMCSNKLSYYSTLQMVLDFQTITCTGNCPAVGNGEYCSGWTEVFAFPRNFSTSYPPKAICVYALFWMMCLEFFFIFATRLTPPDTLKHYGILRGVQLPPLSISGGWMPLQISPI